MWTSGIRPPKHEGEWYPLALSILRYKFHENPARGATAATETGLALAASCYWYVWRSDDLYGEVVFLWGESAATRQDNEGAVSPFDSGGFWRGKVQSDRTFHTAAEKRSFFNSVSVKMSEWRQRFLDYVTENYDNVRNYVEGKPPAVGTAGIIVGPPNESPAWTWEARVSKTEYRKQVTVESIYWLERDRSRFEDFLVSATLDDDDMVAIAELMERHSHTCPVGASPGREAREELCMILEEATSS